MRTKSEYKMINNILKRLEAVTDKQAAITLFISAFILRLIYALYMFIHQAFDENNAYIIIAKYIIEQGTLFYDINSTYLNAAGPVLPWLNALTLIVFHNNYIGIYIVTALGSALITLLTYKTARLFLDKMTSFFIGVWSLFYFFYFHFTPTPGKDIWMAFFMIFLVYYFIVLFEKKEFSYFKYILFILMFVISFHLDERYFVFSPFIALYILYFETSGFKKLKIKKTLLFGTLLILLMIPWTLRNYYNFNKLVILTTRTERIIDPLLGNETRENILDDAYEIEAEYYIYDYQIDSVIKGTKTTTNFGYKISDAHRDALKRGELPEPLSGSKAFFSRINTMFQPFQLKGRYVRSGYYYYKKSLRNNLVTFLFYGVVFFFSFPGFYYLFYENRKIFYLFGFIIFIYGLIHALAIPYTNWRYRLPLDAIFIIVGCFGILKVLELLKNRINA